MKAKKRYQFYSQQIPKKNKSQFISFLFRPSFGVKRTICFLILLPLPFPPRTAGLNSCCYDAQRQGARRLPGTQFISLKPKMILKQLFFTPSIGKCGVCPSERSASGACNRCCVANEAGVFELIKCAPAQQSPT